MSKWKSVENPPDVFRKVLVSFSNALFPEIGCYVADSSGHEFISVSGVSFIKLGLEVNGWRKLPKCKGKEKGKGRK